MNHSPTADHNEIAQVFKNLGISEHCLLLGRSSQLQTYGEGTHTSA